MSEIAECWEKLQSGVPLASFLAYIRACQPMPCTCATERPTAMKPHTICRQATGENGCQEYRRSYTLPAQPADWNRYQKACRLEQLGLLELAAAHCFAAKVMVTKPTRELLEIARKCCLLFDEKCAELDRIEKKRDEACKKGGCCRQGRLNPAREYARRLYTRHRPPAGWKNTTVAIRAIMPKVIKFVLRSKLPVFAGDDEATIRTIRSWLKGLTNASSKASEPRNSR